MATEELIQELRRIRDLEKLYPAEQGADASMRYAQLFGRATAIASIILICMGEANS